MTKSPRWMTCIGFFKVLEAATKTSDSEGSTTPGETP